MKINIVRFALLFLVLSCNGSSKESLNQKDKIEKYGNREMVLKNMADSFYYRREFKVAVSYFDSLIQMDSMKGEYYFKRGYSNDMNSDSPIIKRVNADYLKSIKLGYNPGSGYFNLGVTYMYIDDSLALIFLNKSFKINPSHPGLADLIRGCKNRIAEKTKTLK